MKRQNIHNFGAGPAAMAKEVIEATAKAVNNFWEGLSILEISHRSKEWINVMNETKALMKEVMDIPEGYEILFFGGGASLQFLMVAMNLLNKKACYLDTGVWASKAIKEAENIGEVKIIGTSKDKNYTYIPEYQIPSDYDYFHITTNNTIYGTEIKKDIESPIPLVADMSSDILSRPIDISKYSLIYAGAQKNCGAAGATIVIIKKEILGKVQRKIPIILDYQVHILNNSMYNTPPVISIFTVNQTLKYIKKIGGLKKIQELNEEKARLLYAEIDRNKIFKGTVLKKDRSIMNVCFVMEEQYKQLENEFSEYALQKGIIGIKGHRSVGGFRASIYNAVTIESVQALINCMHDFEQLHTH
ncbi:hypothetical protein ENUP19_0154G0018 [Entamoeba nuttalli]|uniref:phosphoserine transaminase n=1 Tax=Entamoeba nuttalli TaxID=412467 RepID=A0ABQ0DL52_9EUKA